MQKIKLERFEQEFEKEINLLRSAQFQTIKVPTAPAASPYHSSLSFLSSLKSIKLSRAMSIAFAVPAFAIVFGIFLGGSGDSANKKDLALLEESNNRIMEQINTLDNGSKF